MSDPHEFDMLELQLQPVCDNSTLFFTDDEVATTIANLSPQCETELFSIPVNKTPGTYIS